MQPHRSNVGTLVGGTFLIALGLLALAGQVFPSINWGFLWPFTVIGFGALFFVVMFAGGKQAAAFAIPGSIITGIGMVLLFQNITHHWESMSYFWTLILIFVGAGIYIMGWRSEDDHQKRSGMRVMRVGLILFVIFGAFFEMSFSRLGSSLFPFLLIALGLYLLLVHSGLWGARKSEPSDPLPPLH